IVTSDDGINWTICSSGTNGALNGVAFGENNFVAVGAGVILTSADGISWDGNTRSPYLLYGVNFCYDEFVAIGVGGTILISGNGHGWVNCSSGTTADLKHATFGNNCFVVVGASGTVLTSPDAISWSNCSSGTSYSLTDISYGNGTFVTVGGRGTILASTYTAPANNAPQASNVSIGGNPQIGATLTSNYNYFDAENNPEGNSTLQWFRATKADGSDKQAINGATARKYIVRVEDRNCYLFVQVTPIATIGISQGQAVLSPCFGPVMGNAHENWTDRPLLKPKAPTESLFITLNQDLDASSANEGNIYCTSDLEGLVALEGFGVQAEGLRQIKVSPSSAGWPVGECYLFISSRLRSSSGQYLKNPIRCHFSVEDVYLPPAESWNLEDGWSIMNQDSGPVLTGQGHKWARLPEKIWDNHTMKCRLKLIKGGVHINCRLQEDHGNRYFVGLNNNVMELHKQEGAVFHDGLAQASWNNDANWHDVEIRAYQGIINFYIDGNLKLVYEDDNYIPNGIVAFESLDDSEVQISDVRIVATNAADVTTN
ncbi:MAG: hypothetical protein ABFD08_09135, partial [Syntrophomonas sp.]